VIEETEGNSSPKKQSRDSNQNNNAMSKGPEQNGAINFETGTDQTIANQLTSFTNGRCRHKAGAKHGIENQSNQQRAQKRYDHRDGKIFHEFAHDSRPEDHGTKRTNSCQGGCKHGVGNLTGAETCSLVGTFSLTPMSENIFHNHDGIIDQHTEGQNQAEKHNHIQSDAHGLQDHKCDEHGKWNGRAHKEGIANPEKRQENQENQQQSAENIVLQFGHHVFDLNRLIGNDGNIHAIGEIERLMLNNGPNSLRHLDDVFSAALLDQERDGIDSTNTADGFTILDAKLDGCQIPQENRWVNAGIHYKIQNFFRLIDFSRHAHLVVVHSKGEFSSGNGHVLKRHRVLNIEQAEVVVDQFFRIDFHLDFVFNSAHQVHGKNTRNLLQIFLKIFSKFFQQIEVYLT